MPRNIILCADGTGNKGGFTPDSNVFKTYNAVDIKNHADPQITYYDNGVGTSTNKILKGISGGVGVGFRRNVRELYTFLSKNYRPAAADDSCADRVYIFGFSRGAATIRALNGFIHDCGLIDARDCDDDLALNAEVRRLMELYLTARYKNDNATLTALFEGDSVAGLSRPRHAINIEFIGAWDTVAALGMPKNTDDTGWFSRAVNALSTGIDSVVNHFCHHRAYNFQLTPNIVRACQALAIDDARTAFWPRIWNEKDPAVSAVEVDQIWFAGMHSDVGGGYQRQAMSDVPLRWILQQAQRQGLRFNNGALAAIDDRANQHDKIHNSRDGLGMFYRYHPRDIASLCVDEIDPTIALMDAAKIHQSVLSRMYHRTAGYAPALLPTKFDVVNDDGFAVQQIDLAADSDWQKHSKEGGNSIKKLKEMYIYQLMFSLGVLGLLVYATYCWALPEVLMDRGPVLAWLVKALQFVLPDMFEKFIILSVNECPYIIASIASLTAWWFWRRSRVRYRLLKSSLAKRAIVIGRYTGRTSSVAAAD